MEDMQSNSSLARENATIPQDSANAAEQEINIYLKVMKTVPFMVKRSDTVKNLKEMFRAKYGYSENIQQLFFTGERLVDTQTLVDCGIKKDSTVNVIVQSFESLQLSIKSLSNQRTIVVEARACDSVKKIKGEIQNHQEVDSEKITLFYDGKLLEDDSTVASLKLQSGSILYFVPTPKEVLPIYVKKLNGDLVKVEAKVVFTIQDVKAMIQSMPDIFLAQTDWHLGLSGERLEDCRTLSSYGFKEGLILDILPQEFQVFVKNQAGKTIILDVNGDDTIEAVKLKYCQKMKMNALSHRSLRLLYDGKYLRDYQSLASYKIQKDSTLYQSCVASVE